MLQLRHALLVLVCGAFAVSAQASDTERLAELWRVGSLWQVGDNIQRVSDARQAIIDTGEPGLEYALNHLHVSDTLQVRCLYAVVSGFGQAAIEPLAGHISHEDANARRNVAELLRRLEARRTTEALLRQAREEPNIGTRLAQLTALSAWEEPRAVTEIARASRHTSDRVRHSAAGLLSPFADREATGRLLEMLHDEVYFVREAAVDALRKGSHPGRTRAVNALQGLAERDAEPAVWRLLIRASATCVDDATGGTLVAALSNEDAGVRGEAASALAEWHQGSGSLQDRAATRAALERVLASEADPYARPQIVAALEKLAQLD
jgi:hypothetical protein